jgi:hypothetical protein
VLAVNWTDGHPGLRTAKLKLLETLLFLQISFERAQNEKMALVLISNESNFKQLSLSQLFAFFLERDVV